MATLSGKLAVSQAQDQLIIKIIWFSSGDIAAQLSGFTNLDWRSSVAHVAIDIDYDGSNFEARLLDSPGEATDFVQGVYSVQKDQAGACIAVKITDILGESVVLTHEMDNQ